jgi:hypothetical protein
MTSSLDVGAILRVLSKHHVRYVVIGGVAATLHGVPIRETLDIDVTPSRGPKNEERLADALVTMDAKLRVPGLDDGFEIPLDGRTFRHSITMTFITKYGPFDVCFRPDGTEGYEDIAKGAATMERFGIEILVASVPDIIRSKEAAMREKDAEHLPLLYRFLAERDE